MRRNLASLIGFGRFVPMLAALSVAAIAGQRQGQKKVSLTLEGVQAERWDEGRDVMFGCKVNLQNDTGAELEVRSHFSSIYDGLELVVFSESGEKLIQQPHTWHQSPHSFSRDRAFPVARGANRATLTIPTGDLKTDVRKVKVQVVGVLPGCDMAGVLASGLVDVTIVPRAMRGPLPASVRSLEVEFRDPATNRSVTFTDPPGGWDAVLAALMPVRRDENPASWERLGTLKILKWDETLLTVSLYSVGRGPAAFSIEGPGKETTYYRGGSSDALIRALRSAREARVTTNRDTRE
jgi:hypothetical protein